MHVYTRAVDIVVRVYLAKTFLTNIYMDILLKLNVLTYSWQQSNEYPWSY